VNPANGVAIVGGANSPKEFFRERLAFLVRRRPASA
jgi:hypothetical protein